MVGYRWVWLHIVVCERISFCLFVVCSIGHSIWIVGIQIVIVWVMCVVMLREICVQPRIGSGIGGPTGVGVEAVFLKILNFSNVSK